MRTTVLAVLFALVAGCATADQIDNVVTNLPDNWPMGGSATPVFFLPQTAPLDQLLTNSFHCWQLDDSITDYKVINRRQITNPRAHIPKGFMDSYLAVLVQTRHGEKIVLIGHLSRQWFRRPSNEFSLSPFSTRLDWFLPEGSSTNVCWWSQVVDAKPSPR
jgi:hypothetical protein